MKLRQAHPMTDYEWMKMRLRDGPLSPNYEWDRRDPDYDPIRPLEVLAMLPVAVAVLIAALCIVGFLLAVLAGPEVRG